MRRLQSELLDTLRSILGDGVEARQALMRIMSGKPANAAPAGGLHAWVAGGAFDVLARRCSHAAARG